jgi:hypothetical protein
MVLLWGSSANFLREAKDGTRWPPGAVRAERRVSSSTMLAPEYTKSTTVISWVRECGSGRSSQRARDRASARCS